MDDEQHTSAGPDELEREAVAAYLTGEIARAFAAHQRAAPGTVQRQLPLGEMLALFNFADQFGLLDAVRADLDHRQGRNSYLAFSEAMKDALLDRGFGTPGGQPPPYHDEPRPNRPPTQRRDGPRPYRPPRGGRPRE
jgi:hypothetical protein